MGALRFGPARVPSRESPEAAVELLLERGYGACEIDFEGKFWMDYPWAERFGELAREAGIVLSVHAPIAGFMGHLERDKKFRMAVGMLDHSAGIAAAAGAELVVFHPGFLLGRERADAIDAVVDQLAFLRERLEGKGRAVPFGIEVMGRVRELGTAEDVFAISARLGWVRPVLDFAHMHAVTDGGFTDTEPFAGVLEVADEVLEPGAPFHVHFSRHRVREPQRDEAPALRRGHAARRAARRGARALRAARDRDQRVARRGLEPGDRRDPARRDLAAGGRAVSPGIRWAPKLPVSMIVRLYTLDAEGRHDHDLADDVGWRLLARCRDVLHVTDSEVVCPVLRDDVRVTWIGEQAAGALGLPRLRLVGDRRRVPGERGAPRPERRGRP